MVDVRLWSQDLIADFIKAYKAETCLWKVKSTQYSNRFRRHEAYQRLINFCKKRGFPEANRDFVSRKIQSLRGSFRKEYCKTQNIDSYKPSLWYYDMLLFTKDQEFEDLVTQNADFVEIDEFKREYQDDDGDSYGEESLTKEDGVISQQELDEITNQDNEESQFSTRDEWVKIDHRSLKRKVSEDSVNGVSNLPSISGSETYKKSRVSKIQQEEMQISEPMNKDTEFDVWAKSIAMQLNAMDVRRALNLQLQIQNLVTNERLIAMDETEEN